MYSKQLHYQGLRLHPSVSTEIDRTDQLSPALESALILRAQQGDHKARQQIISANLAWISAVGGTSSGRGLDDDELLSAGVLGLNEAIDRWKPDQQSNIRTYGQFWIRKFQNESLFQTDTIRIPKSAHEQLAKLRKAKRVIGDEATISELAEYTQIQEKRIIELQSISQPTSLNISIGEQRQTEVLDLQADESSECSDLPLSPDLQDLISRLNPRQQEVIHLRFFDGWTFQDIGNFFSLTSQRIRQIYKAALEKLRGWLVGKNNEPSEASIPAPQRWQHYVFAKLMLATEFCCKSLKRQFQKCFNRFLIPLHLPFHPLEKNTDSFSKSASQSAIPEQVHTEILHHHIDSGGLRDGPKGRAQRVENWPRSTRGREQHRCRGETRVHSRKKKVRLKVFPTLSVERFDLILANKFKPKIEYRNSIRPFSRNSVFLV